MGDKEVQGGEVVRLQVMLVSAISFLVFALCKDIKKCLHNPSF